MQRAIPFFAVVQFASWILRPQYFNPPKLFRRRFYWALGTGRLCNAVNLLGHAEQKHVFWERSKWNSAGVCNQPIAAASREAFLEHSQSILMLSFFGSAFSPATTVLIARKRN